jgi:hypothetical protein
VNRVVTLIIRQYEYDIRLLQQSALQVAAKARR